MTEMPVYIDRQIEAALRLANVDYYDVIEFTCEPLHNSLFVTRRYRAPNSKHHSHFECWSVGPRGAKKLLGRS